MKTTILLAIACCFAYGCSTCDPGPSIYLRGDVVTKLDSVGVLISANATTGRSIPTYVLEADGDTIFVEQDAVFRLSVPEALDIVRLSLKISEMSLPTAGASRKMFAITLTDACSPIVELTKECQLVNWYNPYRLPQIVARNANLNQIVSTPLIADDYSIIGYEIRLGSQERIKCESPALLELQRSDIRKKLSEFPQAAPASKKAPRGIETIVKKKKKHVPPQMK